MDGAALETIKGEEKAPSRSSLHLSSLWEGAQSHCGGSQEWHPEHQAQLSCRATQSNRAVPCSSLKRFPTVQLLEQQRSGKWHHLV